MGLRVNAARWWVALAAWFRPLPWRRAALWAAGWAVLAFATAVAVLYFNPGGAYATAVVEQTAAAILLGSPVAAAVVHRSLRVGGLVAVYFAAVGLLVLVILLLNLPRESPDDQYYREQRSRATLASPLAQRFGT